MKKIQEHGELLFGVHSLCELLKAKKRKLLKLYTTKPEPKAWQTIIDLLPAHHRIPIQYVSREILTKIAGSSDHQGIVGLAQPFIMRKKFFNPEQHPLLIMLDGVQDVHNVGAIARSVYCTNFSGMIMCQKKGASITAAAHKASAGLIEHIDTIMAPSPCAAIQELKRHGYTIYLTFLDGKPLQKVSFNKPLCLVIGNEATGISKEITQAGLHITIPQRSQDISYNASVAAGIALFYIAINTGQLT